MRQVQRFVAGLTVWVAAMPAWSMEPDALWQAIATYPNVVVVMRHTEAVGRARSVCDETGACRDENTLTGKGQRDARAIGEAFARRGLMAERLHVVASAMCRTRDTARLAFGKAELDPALREFLSGRGPGLNAAMEAAVYGEVAPPARPPSGVRPECRDGGGGGLDTPTAWAAAADPHHAPAQHRRAHG